MAKVTRLADFGAFVEIIPGTDGLLHISEVAEHRIKDVRDELKEGDQVLVKVLAVEGNRIRLSRKAILKEQRAKMGGGDGAVEGGGEGAAEAVTESHGEVRAPALTIEGGGDFPDDEPNFNRDGPVGAVDRGPSDRPPSDRGGDRGGEAVVRAAVDGAGLEVVDAEVAADMAGMAVATVVADTSR